MSRRRKSYKGFYLEVVDIHIEDIDNFREWEPADKSDVFFLCYVCVAEKGDDSFFYRFLCHVTTPEGLMNAAYERNVNIPQRALLILKDYSWKNLERLVHDIVDSCSYQNWSVSLSRLERYFEGDYEGRDEQGTV